MFRVANFEREDFFFLVLREIEKSKETNLEGEAFWDSLVLSFNHSENLQQLQVKVTLTLRVNHYKSRVFLCFIFHIGLLSLSENRIVCFNLNKTPVPYCNEVVTLRRMNLF